MGSSSTRAGCEDQEIFPVGRRRRFLQDEDVEDLRAVGGEGVPRSVVVAWGRPHEGGREEIMGQRMERASDPGTEGLETSGDSLTTDKFP